MRHTGSVLETHLSEPAAELYHRLTADGYHAIGPADQTLPPAARELVESGFAVVEHGDPPKLRPVSPAVAAQRVLRDLTQQIGTWQRDASRTVEQLIRLEHGETRNPLARVLTDPDEITALVRDLQADARAELLSLEVPIAAGILCHPQVSPAAANPPPVWRTVYTSAYLEPQWRVIPKTTHQRGGQVRISAALPSKLLVVDRSHVLVPLDQPGLAGTVLFRSATVVDLMVELFEAVWERATPFPVGESADHRLNPFELQVLALLAAGLRDEDIARQTKVSVRTIGRHVSTIMSELQVETRFAAGAVAAKRGWV